MSETCACRTYQWWNNCEHVALRAMYKAFDTYHFFSNNRNLFVYSRSNIISSTCTIIFFI